MKSSTLLTFFCLTLTTTSFFAQTLPLDANFGDDGISKLNIVTGYRVLEKHLVTPDDYIIGAGKSQGFANGSTHLTLVKYRPDGSLDTDFGQNGVAYSPIGEHSLANDLILQPDGKILVAGVSGSGALQSILVARYLPDGTLDASFGDEGVFLLQTEKPSDARALTLQSDGKILIAAHTGTYPLATFLLLRITGDGTIDTDFGNNGTVLTPMPTTFKRAFATEVMQRPDGKIIFVGNHYLGTSGTTARFFVVQYTAQGQLDTAFNGDGIWESGNFYDQASNNAALLPDGRVLVSGTRFGPDDGVFSLIACTILPTGETDTAFGNAGTAVINPGGRLNFANTGLWVKENGQILLEGTSNNDPALGQELATVQLDANGQIDATFNQVGYGFYPLFGYYSRTMDMAVQSNGRVLHLVQYIETSNATAILGFLESTSGSHSPSNAVSALRAYPNPWTSGSVLQYELRTSSTVAVHLLDTYGRYIGTLAAAQTQPQGIHTVRLPLESVPAGCYQVVVESGEGRQTLLLVR